MKNFFKGLGRNWMTTTLGALTILSSVPAVAHFVPVVNQIVDANPKNKADWIKVAIGVGLLFAKDFNVSGGTVKQ